MKKKQIKEIENETVDENLLHDLNILIEKYGIENFAIACLKLLKIK